MNHLGKRREIKQEGNVTARKQSERRSGKNSHGNRRREAASTGPVSTPPEPGFPFRADAISPTQDLAKRDPAVGKKLRHDHRYNRGAKPVSNGLRPSYVLRPDE